MIERRRLVRTKVEQPAKVLAEDADVLHRCVVADFSTLGACIVWDAELVKELPPKFDLSFDNYRTFWVCEVIWYDSQIGRIGVSWKPTTD